MCLCECKESFQAGLENGLNHFCTEVHEDLESLCVCWEGVGLRPSDGNKLKPAKYQTNASEQHVYPEECHLSTLYRSAFAFLTFLSDVTKLW